MKQIGKLGRFLGPLVFRTNQNVPADIPVQHNQPKPSTSQQGRILPSELQQPRVVDQHNFPQAPVESVGPSRRPIHSPMVEREIQTEQPEVMEQGVQADIPAAPVSHPIPLMEDQGTQTDPLPAPPRAIKPFNFSVGGDIGGGGRFPPRYGSGGGENPGDQPPDKPPLALKLLAIVGGYSIYQWGLYQFEPALEEEIEALEKEQQYPISKAPQGRPMLAMWQARGKNLVRRGSVLVGGIFAGGDLFRRALNVTIVPGLRQIVRALIPNWVKIPAIFGTVARWAVAPIARVGLFLLSPVARLSLYGVGLTSAFGLVRGFFGEDIVGALAPLVTPMVQTAQSFFAMPAGASFTEFFIEKNIKVFISTFMFGGIAVHFQGLFFGDKRFLSCILVSFFSVSIFLVLNDHIYLSIFVRNLLATYPKIQGCLESPLGFVSVVVGGGTILQSARFPAIVNFFFATMLYISGIWQDALFPK